LAQQFRIGTGGSRWIVPDTDSIPTQRILYNDDVSVDQRIKLELGFIYATLHSGGTTEAEKAKNVADFIEKLFPYIKNDTPVT
jgi:hypothetical protein